MAGWILVSVVEKYSKALQTEGLLTRVNILSATLDIEDIKSLSADSSDLAKPQYVHLKDQLSKALRIDPHLRFAYLMAKKNGQVVFLVDGEPQDSPDFSPPGQIYHEASEKLHSVFESNTGIVEGPLSDRWGEWVSALVPLTDNATQEVVAVIGLDVNASLWSQGILIYRIFAIAVWTFFFLIIAVAQYFVNRQRQIMSKMFESEERFRNVANSSGDWIWETDRQGKYTYSSFAIKEILGYGPHEVVSKKYFYDFAFPQDRELLKAQAEKAILEDQSFIREIARRRHKNGNEVILDIRGFALRDTKGRIIGYRGVDRDITELKTAEEKIEENRKAIESANRDLAANEKILLEMIKDMEISNRQLRSTQDQLIQSEKMASVGVLASGVAHEIKNPLAIILQGMERIEKILTQTPGDGIQYISMVKNAAVRANRVINALLKFSRSSQLEVKPLQIHELIDAAILLVENKAKLSNVQFRRDYTLDPFLISGDSILLEQVFFDLFMNAIDAMPNGGELTIASYLQTAFESGESVRKLMIDVKDTGTGIPSEYIGRVFDPFFTTKEPGKGTGLGLSTVYLILERHKGSIRVASTPGAGTTFTITLPVA